MGIFRNDNEAGYVGGRKHFADVIKNRADGSLLISRAPEEDFNDGSTLVVMPGEAAIFIKGGIIEGVLTKGTHVLSSQNYPFLSRLRNALTGGVSAYNCVIYFVRLADGVELKWGTASPLQVRDKVLGVPTEVSSHGTYKVRVVDPEALLERLLGNNVNFLTQQGLNDYFSSEFQEKIRSELTKELDSREKELLGIESELGTYSARLEARVGEVLSEYGLSCQAFSIEALVVNDSAYRKRWEDIGLGNYEKLSDYLTEKQAMDQLGPQWAALVQARILEKGVSNPGGAGYMGDIASIIAGTTAIAPAMHHAMSVPGGVGQPGAPSVGGGSGRFTQVGDDAVSTAGSDAAGGGAETRRARLRELKSYFDEGLISEEDYNRKRGDILGQL